MTFEELEAKVAELRREAALMLTDLDDSLAIVERLKDDGGVVVEMEAPQDQEGKVTHLPECWFYDPAKTPAVAVNDGWPCICDRLRACEQRMMLLRYNEIRGWSAMKEAIAYDAALDACIAAVREAIGEEWQGRIIPKSEYDCCGCSSYSSIVDDATDAINVLREEKL